MKIIKFLKWLFGFLIFIVFNFIIRNIAINLIYPYNTTIELDIIDKILLYIIFLFFFAMILCLCILLVKMRFQCACLYNFAKAILNHKLKIFLWITFLSLSIFSGLILLLYPIIYYYVFKTFLKKYSLIEKYYLDFRSVKKYMLIFFIIEFPLVLGTLALFFDPESNGGSALFFTAYYMLGNFYFYLPFFVFSWWDNRKLKIIK